MSYNENLQRNNDALRGILDEVNALPEGTGGVQPDYLQNDPAERDFIKNRPFYDDEKWRIVHEVRQFVSTSTGIDWIIGSDNIFDTVPIGTKCRIVVDGATYIGTMAAEPEDTGYYHRYIGNGYLKNSALPDTGEPFVFFASGLDCMAMIPCDTMPSAATISVLESGELVRIDPKFLPEPVQSDYWQNDPAAHDYIKNRPFYRVQKWKCVQEPQVIELTQNSQSVTGEMGFCFNFEHFLCNKYPDGTVFKLILGTDEYVGTYKAVGGPGLDFVGNGALLTVSGADHPDTGEDFLIYYFGADGIGIVTRKPLKECEVSVYMLEGEEIKKIDPQFLPDEVAARKPLILDANLSDYYGGHPEAGDEALEAIKTGRQILVRVPNASGDNYVASYSPVYFTQLPLDGQYLYLFYLRDEKQDLSALLGQPAGTVVMPTYGQLMMLLSHRYDSNPLEG